VLELAAQRVEHVAQRRQAAARHDVRAQHVAATRCITRTGFHGRS
jgi:hypothetical protein